LILEWIEDDLGSFRLDDRDVRTLLTHVSMGLGYMHANGFTHRDLKPENILIQSQNHRLRAAKIADFGTTKFDLSGKMQTYAGSSIYMAPEFWEQELNYTNAVDMWSFGIIALELLTRVGARLVGWDARLPPSKAQHQEWIHGDLRRRVADTPEEFKPLIQGLLSEIAEDRWTAVDSNEWLQKDVQANTGSKKRTLSSTTENIADLQQRRFRSTQPL
jgi:serine/threonine protein kinase